MKKSELLVPVGNMECLYAAIFNGADAVYLGGKKFGARAYSNNFSDDEMIDAIKLCHLYGVKIYVTVNTMIYDCEVSDVIQYLSFLYTHRVDAVIMQDNGMITLARKLLPNLEIHVSTQAHNHNYDGISYYEKIGCKRVVFDRESSLEDIIHIDVPIEKEVFVYGALCISYSGNCLFSALNGERSANRGMCVGSCRLPYSLLKDHKKTDEGFLLSTKDLNTLEYLKDLLDQHIDSLKIEGRMKSKEYVSVVTRTFRKLIDDYYENKDMIIHDTEKTNLLKVFNRDFTEGYLFHAKSIINSSTSNHQGVKIGNVVDVNSKYIKIKLDDYLTQGDAIRFKKSKTGMYVNSIYDKNLLLTRKVLGNNVCYVANKDHLKFNDLVNSDVLKTIDIDLVNELDKLPVRKIPITMNFIGRLNEPIKLVLSDSVHSIIVSGNNAQTALKAPISVDSIKEHLSKLGNTPFSCDHYDVSIDSNIFINIKDINELRREGIEKLKELREGNVLDNVSFNIPSYEVKKGNKKISVLVRNQDQLDVAINNNIDVIYLEDEDLYYKYKDQYNVYLRLPRVILNHKEYENERLLVGELGGLVKYGKKNIVHTDYFFNTANNHTIDCLNNLGSKCNSLSVELSNNDYDRINLKETSEVIIYGTLENMIIKNNIFHIDNEETYLVDSNHQKYPCIYQDGFTIIYNHEIRDFIKDIPFMNDFEYYRIDLFQEDRITTENIITRVKSMLY